ncbi:MAG: response regulator [Spirochaetales bacterium]|nr:response regulator [Spirochaetales bacterium]
MSREKRSYLLLIDDEEPFCTVNTTILRLSGYDADYVLNAEEGIEFLRNNPDTDVVLLDIDLGEGMTGTEALPVIIEQHPVVQVIMITSNRNVTTGVDCMKKGAFDYLTKPFQKQDLVRVIEGAIERKKIIQLKNLYLEILVHDFKNPLQNISMGIDAMDADDHMLREKARNLAKFGCWQIQNMVNNILSITQFEKATPALEMTSFLLTEQTFLPEISSLADQIAFTGRQFHLLFPGKKKYQIKTEKNLFFQVISNLLSNAIRFTRKGDSITVEITETDARFIEVKVANTGSFIEEDLRNNIFDKFFKPRFAGKHQGRNFGLGLTFCKYAADALGGAIHVESTPDPPETSFYFTVRMNR